MSELNRRVAIRNNTDALFYYEIPNRHVKREIPAHGFLRVPFEEIQEGLYDKGLRIAFQEGRLKIVNEQDALDLEINDILPKSNHSVEELAAIIRKGDKGEIEKVMREATSQEQQSIITLLVHNGISDKFYVDLVKKLYNYDLLKAITIINEQQ